MQTANPSDIWPTLEIAKLIVGVLTPLSMALLGWLLSQHLKRVDLIYWTNQKLIEKRLLVYDQLAPDLNSLLCFYTWVGYWKEVSPKDAIHAKRNLDKTIHIYRHLFDDGVYNDYQAFIHLLFRTRTEKGSDAKIRSLIISCDGNRTTDAHYKWIEEWNSCFAESKDAAAFSDIYASHDKLMNSLTSSFGIKISAA